jgi:RNA 2',3'-cyclic 3'-phosphodiesterase
MRSSATVGGSERLRLFCALTLPEAVLDGLVAWQREELSGDARTVPRDNLHVTVAFLGTRPAADAGPVTAALGAAALSASEPICFQACGYRETRSVGMVVLDDEDGHAGELAFDIFRRLEQIGVYERERRSWLPHITVLRFRRPPRLRPPLPELGAFSPSGAAVYHSLLRPGGAHYEILESFALGG